jgi:acetoin utilization deacetylase AcuC-like enzyme
VTTGRGPVPVFFSPEYVVAAHSFDTTRKAGWVAESLAADPIDGVELRVPTPLTEGDLLACHDPAYVTAIRTGEPRDLAETNEFTWDPSLWTMVCASNGGAVQAALTALHDGGVAGSLSSGLHHAKRRRGDGYCTFNGLALAARRVLGEGARGVLILDLDAHCGGGTFDILGDEPRVRSVDIAVSPYDGYDPNERTTLDVLTDATAYLPTLRDRLAAVSTDDVDLVIYNAGMDPYERCRIGGLSGMTAEVLAEREAMVFAWAAERGVPVAFVLAGGYVSSGFDAPALVALHRLTLAAAADGGDPRGPVFPAAV